MDALTRQLYRVVQNEQIENREEETDAREQVWEVQVSRVVLRFHRFELLDEVFEAFLTTNQRSGCNSSFPQLLAEATHYKKYYFFDHHATWPSPM
ncbi:hypothetical protein ABBQ38_007437 [Trebouxia sp. C0009 RCD-2024]